VVGSDYGLTAAAAIGEEAVGDDMLMACAIGEVDSGTLLLVSMASSNAPARRPARTLLRCRRQPTGIVTLLRQSSGPTTRQENGVRQNGAV